MAAALDIDELMVNAGKAASFLRTIASEHRLLILCHLLDRERSVGELNRLVGLTPSNLSQHLARLRAEGLLDVRRNGTTLFYRVVSPEVRAILTQLHRLFCARPATS